MAYRFSSFPLPGDTVAAFGPQYPRPDPVSNDFAYLSYEDATNNPGILTVAEIDLSTQNVSRSVALAGSDDAGTIALSYTAAYIAVFSAINGGGSYKFWLIDKTTFTVIKTSASWVPPSFIAIQDANICISNNGEWVVVFPYYDNGGPGQYWAIWHTTTGTIYHNNLSVIIAVPNSVTAMCFDQNGQLYLAVGFAGDLHKIALAEAAGVITPTLLNTFVLPQTNENVWAITLRPSTNKFTLWMQSPHGVSAASLLMYFWDLSTDTVDPTSYTVDYSTADLGAGMNIYDKWGATERTKFLGIFGLSGGGLTNAFFAVTDITTGTFQQYDISLWETDFVNNPPTASGVYSAPNYDFYVVMLGVNRVDDSRFYFLPRQSTNMRSIVPMPELHYAFGVSDMGPIQG